jgi:hypothetical protein
VPGRLVAGLGSGGGVCSHFTLVLLLVLVHRRSLAGVVTGENRIFLNVSWTVPMSKTTCLR